MVEHNQGLNCKCKQSTTDLKDKSNITAYYSGCKTGSSASHNTTYYSYLFRTLVPLKLLLLYASLCKQLVIYQISSNNSTIDQTVDSAWWTSANIKGVIINRRYTTIVNLLRMVSSGLAMYAVSTMSTALMLVVTCFTAAVEANTEVRVTQSDTKSLFLHVIFVSVHVRYS